MSAARPRASRAAAFYGLLLRAYPYAYRARFGDAMRETFLHDYAQVRAAGLWRLLPFWMATVAQAVWFGMRERHGGRVWTPRLPDVALGVKMLRSPRELPAMIVALAVGVGLTVTAYSLLHAVLFTPLPYAQPDELVRVWDVRQRLRSLSERQGQLLNVAPSPFEGLAHYGSTRVQSLQRGAGSSSGRQVRGAPVSVNLFAVLGVNAAKGRTFHPDDEHFADISPLVISERLARTGLVSGALDELLYLDGTLHRVIGIMPEAFWFPDRDALYWKLRDPPPPPPPGGGISISAPFIARLPQGTSLVVVEAQANARVRWPNDPSVVLGMEPYALQLTAPVRPALLVLQTASVLVLLLVCLNVGWLFAVRARRLRPAFTAMRALGATTGQVLGTHVVSAVCVALAAAPCAILVAWILLRFGLTLESGVFSTTAEPAVPWHVATVALALTVLASIGSCLPGTFVATRWNGSFKDDARIVTRSRLFERSAMSLQVGLVFALGAQAVLVALVLASLSRTNVGLTRTDLVVVSLESRDQSIDIGVQLPRYNLLLERLERRGVRTAAANMFPLLGVPGSRSNMLSSSMARFRVVTPSYFPVTGMTATRGRLLTNADIGTRRVVVTDAFAEAAFPGQDPIGGQLGEDRDWTIVGVTSAVRQLTVHEEVEPEVYVLYDDLANHATGVQIARGAVRQIRLIAETTSGTEATLQIIRAEVAEQMPDVEIRSEAHVEDLIDANLGANRLVSAGAAVFAAVALLLAALGLYAMVSHGLALRRREIGIRMALGATVRRIAVESVRPVALVYGAGLCMGIALLLFARSAIQAVMVPPPGVAYPPLLMVAGIAGATLLATVAVACYRPIKAETQVDPAVSLRVE